MIDEEYNDEQHENSQHDDGEQTTDNQQRCDDEEQNAQDYDVGYCKTPKHSRYKKGESGNPSGRPRKKKDFRSFILNELEKKIKLKRFRYPKKLKEVFGMSLINNAIEGKTKALDKLWSILVDSEDPEDFELTQRDINMIKRLDGNVICELDEPDVKDKECNDDEDGTGSAVVPT